MAIRGCCVHIPSSTLYVGGIIINKRILNFKGGKFVPERCQVTKGNNEKESIKVVLLREKKDNKRWKLEDDDKSQMTGDTLTANKKLLPNATNISELLSRLAAKFETREKILGARMVAR